MLETLSIMQHHDAITGTHMNLVGENYAYMIDKVVEHSLSKPMNKYKSVASQVSMMASSEGIQLDKIQACKLEGGVIERDWNFLQD